MSHRYLCNQGPLVDHEHYAGSNSYRGTGPTAIHHCRDFARYSQYSGLAFKVTPILTRVATLNPRFYVITNRPVHLEAQACTAESPHGQFVIMISHMIIQV